MPQVKNQKRQQGMMNILIVLLLGSLMSALVFSLYMNNSSGQQRTQTMHAITHAQSGVWLSINAVNAYFQTVDLEDLETLYSQEPDSIALSFADSSVAGKFIPDYSYPDTNFDRSSGTFTDPDSITLAGDVYFSDSSAKTSSGMFTVFQRAISESSGSQSGDLGIILYGDTEFNQQSSIISDDDNKTTLTIIGEFTNNTTSDSLTGLKALKATGSITLKNNNQHFEEIHSDTSVNLSNSGLKSVISKVSSGGNISIGLDVTVGEAHANGNIDFNSKNDSNLLQARDTVNVNSKSQGTVSLVKANESIVVHWASKSVVSLQSKQAIISGQQNKLESVLAEDTITCSNNLKGVGGSTGLTLTAASFSACNANDGSNGSNIITLNTIDSTLSQVSEVTLINEPTKPIINALAYADEANLLFRSVAKGSDRLIVVKIQNMATQDDNGNITQIPARPSSVSAAKDSQWEGYNYWVTRNGYVCPRNKSICSNYKKSSDYVHKALDQNDWNTSKNVVMQICRADRDNACIVATGGAQSDEFLLNSKAHNLGDNVPGVYLFEGQLILNSDTDVQGLRTGFIGNTFIATHNIFSNAQKRHTHSYDLMGRKNSQTTGNNLAIASPNFAGRAALCLKQDASNIKKVDNTGNISTVTGQNQTQFNHVFPTNYCGANNDNYSPRSLGNVALLAGSSITGTLDTETGIYQDYSGGDIFVNKALIYGTTLAGNRFYNSDLSLLWGNVITLDNKCDYQNNCSSINENDFAGVSIKNNDLPEDTYSMDILPILNCENGQADCQFVQGAASRITQSKVLWARYK